MKVILPFKYRPRPYQVNLYNAFNKGVKRFITIWHRRCGKDKTWFNIMVRAAFERIGAYYYYFPTLSEGRKIIWEGMDKDGFKFLDHIPKELILKKNDHEMKIKLSNGSLIQICGTDRLDVVGPNPVGAVFSEWPLQNPMAYDLIRPILRENDGWAGFNGTPRGKNHAFDMFNMAMNNPDWFCEKLTVDDTKGIIKQEDIQKDRDEGMSEELVQQEYYCSFEYGLEGSYFAQLMAEASGDGRIGSVPFEKDLPVSTAWDIGVSDSNGIWFFQDKGNWLHIIDYYEMNNVGIEHYANVLEMRSIKQGYVYNNHFAPHDIKVREWGSATATRKESASKLGIDFTIIPKVKFKQDSIDAARAIIPKCRFDRVKCKHGIDALQNYQKQWNKQYNVFADKPLHNWASNGADAFQTLAMAQKIYIGSHMTVNNVRELERRCLPEHAI